MLLTKCNFNETSLQTGIENEDNYQLTRSDLDITPNIRDYPTKQSMAFVRRRNVLILGRVPNVPFRLN